MVSTTGYLHALAAGLAAALACAAPAAAQTQFDPYETVTGTAEAQEGDILIVGGRTIRLYGIDAPEMGQICTDRRGREYDCGAGARNILTMIVRDRELDCTVYGQTIDGLQAGRCFIGTADVGRAMVLRGWAFAYRAFTHRYQDDEARAQDDRAGFWQGRAERPWIWRSQQIRASGG
ncbi:MAG: thermonuclease family protein [Rhodospirillaceae bacterium]|nr:thermonuclease family protein [Rhodospirillaceae bacterium]